MTSLPKINPKKETEKIIHFIKKTFREQKIEKAVIGLSGGIDSAVSFSLLTRALKPKQIIALYLPYSVPFFKSKDKSYQNIKKLLKKNHFPEKNFFLVPIARPTEKILDTIKTAGMSTWRKIVYGANECFTCPNTSVKTKTRAGNIMARTRMVLLFDFAKKYDALVCGTENKSERLLGYFTRFGDQASDIEPITGLYKTYIYELAKYLKVPKEIIEQNPTAGLWENQTDEGEFGFTYEEADQVLYQYFDKKKSVKQIKKLGFKNVGTIIKRSLNNSFKKEVPYFI
jgi:NAD+ synthase